MISIILYEIFRRLLIGPKGKAMAIRSEFSARILTNYLLVSLTVYHCIGASAPGNPGPFEVGCWERVRSWPPPAMVGGDGGTGRLSGALALAPSPSHNVFDGARARPLHRVKKRGFITQCGVLVLHRHRTATAASQPCPAQLTSALLGRSTAVLGQAPR